jgi:hypothetical protein
MAFQKKSMIPFFRKIRFQQAENNQFLKYSRYAIGEIVLVVIGILIALQINNWNEDRKKLKLKASYEASLISDLARDTLMLGKLIDENEKTMESLQMQRKRFLGPDTPIDTLVKIARHEFNPDFNVRFKYNRNTLNTLISSGNIDLFSQEINQMLMNLVSSQDLERENSNFFSQVYMNKISRFSDEFPVSGHVNSNIFDSIWRNADKKRLASGFISLTDIKGYAHRSLIKEAQIIKEQTTAILDRLNGEN